MKRSIDRWRFCLPSAMSTQSKAAVTYAFEDARHDILELTDQNLRLRELLKMAAYPKRGTEEENMDIQRFADIVQSIYTIEQLEG